jgi:hypothetical protein
MKHGVVYKGVRGSNGCLVTCDGAEIAPRNDLRNHSATGFDWGVIGGGTAQLALAMLCDFLRDDRKALQLYEEFKTDILAPIGNSTWTIKSESMVEWTRRKMKESKNASKSSAV